MINVSFNELAIGNDLPTQRAGSRPAEASAFAAMMDETDARRPAASDNTRDRHEPRSAETRETPRTDRPAPAERPNDRDATTAPADDSKSTATTSRDNDPTSEPRNDAPTTRSRDNAGSVKHDAAEQTNDSSTHQTADDRSHTTTESTDDTATQTPSDKDPADETTADAAQTDESQVTILVPTVTLIQTPAQPVAATPSFDADGQAPIAAAQTATPSAPQLPDGEGMPSQTQPGQTATAPAAPQFMADLASSDNAGQSTANGNSTGAAATTAPAATPAGSNATPVSPDATPAASTTPATTPAAPTMPFSVSVTSDKALTAPAKGSNATAATLFAATTLSQDTTTEATAPQPTQPQTSALAQSPSPQTAPEAAAPAVSQTPVDSAAAKATSPTPATEPAVSSESKTQQINAASTNTAPANAQPANGTTTAPSQTIGNAAPLLGGSSIDMTVTQDVTPAPLKPEPSLANGMATQTGHAQSGEAKAATSATSFGALNSSATAQNSIPTQTAMAVAATPAAPAVADEPRAKTDTPDGLVINAPAPITAGHTTQTAALDATATGKPAVPTPPVFDQVAVHVAKAAADGLDKINIKLKPASLGQIEVQLEVAADGRVHAVIAADKPETLDLLQRDARSLERALGDAGLRADSGSLSFNLRGQGQQQFGNGQGFAGYDGGSERSRNDIALPADNAVRVGAYLNSRAAAGGVDIRV